MEKSIVYLYRTCTSMHSQLVVLLKTLLYRYLPAFNDYQTCKNLHSLNTCHQIQVGTNVMDICGLLPKY